MAILELDDLRKLNLDSHINSFIRRSNNQTVNRYYDLESSLMEQITLASESYGIKPELPYYLALLHHEKLMTAAEMEEHISSLIGEENNISGNAIYQWLRKMRVPIRDMKEARLFKRE